MFRYITYNTHFIQRKNLIRSNYRPNSALFGAEPQIKYISEKRVRIKSYLKGKSRGFTQGGHKIGLGEFDKVFRMFYGDFVLITRCKKTLFVSWLHFTGNIILSNSLKLVHLFPRYITPKTKPSKVNFNLFIRDEKTNSYMLQNTDKY